LWQRHNVESVPIRRDDIAESVEERLHELVWKTCGEKHMEKGATIIVFG
jgi:hypothetical protein